MKYSIMLSLLLTACTQAPATTPAPVKPATLTKSERVFHVNQYGKPLSLVESAERFKTERDNLKSALNQVTEEAGHTENALENCIDDNRMMMDCGAQHERALLLWCTRETDGHDLDDDVVTCIESLYGTGAAELKAMRFGKMSEQCIEVMQ